MTTLQSPSKAKKTANDRAIDKLLKRAAEIVSDRQEDSRRVLEGSMPREEVTIKDSGLDDDLVALFNASEGNPISQAVVLLWQSTRNSKRIELAIDEMVAVLTEVVKVEPKQ